MIRTAKAILQDLQTRSGAWYVEEAVWVAALRGQGFRDYRVIFDLVSRGEVESFQRFSGQDCPGMYRIKQ